MVTGGKLFVCDKERPTEVGMRLLLTAGIVTLVLFESECWAGAITYKLDNGAANQEIVGDQAGDQAFINVFNADPSAPIITQLSVAWAGLPAGSNVRVVLYSVDDSATSPLPQGVVPTFLNVLQVVNTQITAAQRNDDSGVNPPGGLYGAVWTTYDITPTIITTQRFAVGAIAYEDNATYGCVWQDGTVPPINDILIATAPDSLHDGLAMNSDLSNLADSGTDTINLHTWGDPSGRWDFPYLIQAQGTPEPATISLLVLGSLAVLGCKRLHRTA
jgi:hypothetical protein